MKKTKVLSLITLAVVFVCAIMAFTLTACGGSKVKITLSQTEVTVMEGGKANVAATVTGSDESITWDIDNKDVAEFTTLGKMCIITAKSVGSAKLTASIGEVSAECAITVVPDNTETVTITLDGVEVTEASVDMGSTVTLAATASNGSNLTWVSSNENIATVDNNGVVTGVHPGEATITAKVTESIKASVTLTVNSVGGYEYYEMENTGASGASSSGKWTYYDAGWVFTANDQTPVYDNGTVKLSFSNNAGQWYALQLAYKNNSLKVGQLYKLTFNVNIDTAGSITVNGTQKRLVSGNNNVEIYYTETYNAPDGNTSHALSIHFLFGIDGQNDSEISAANVTMSNFTWTEYTATALKDPSFTLTNNEGEYSVNITDTENDPADVVYRLNFYSANVAKGSVIVTNGAKIDLSSIENGTYEVKLVAEAVSKKNTNSNEVTCSNNTITVNNATTSIGNYDFGGQGYAVEHPGTWVYWADQNWNGSNVLVSECYMDGNKAIHLSYTSSGSNYAGMQMFYEYGTNVTGKNYTLTFKVNSTVAGTITVNGKEFALKTGDNDIVVNYTEPGYGGQYNEGASIQIQFGGASDKSMITGGTFIISNINIEEITSQTKLTAPSFTYNESTKVITINDPTDTTGIGGYELGFFADGAATATVTLTVKSGDVIDTSTISNGTFTVKLMAKASSVLYADSDWSTDTATIVVANASTAIVYGEENNFSSGWRYWDSKEAADWNSWTAANCSSCSMDPNGKITMSFTVSGTGASWAMQMFYKVGDGAANYNTTLKVTASVDCTIIVNNQSVALTAGEKKEVSVSGFKSDNGSAIVIQFGTVGGTFEIEDINVTSNS